jgi:hypothetical protein
VSPFDQLLLAIFPLLTILGMRAAVSPAFSISTTVTSPLAAARLMPLVLRVCAAWINTSECLPRVSSKAERAESFAGIAVQALVLSRASFATPAGCLR